MLWCRLAVLYCRGSFAVPGIDWRRVIRLPLLRHLHILIALAKLSDCLLINDCTQVSSEKKDRERHQHIRHSIYIPSVSALFFIHSENTLLLTAPAIKQELTLSTFSRHPGSFLAHCMATASRRQGPLESWVSSLWSDKSSIERCVMRAAEMASAPGRESNNGWWKLNARTSKDEGWDSIRAASEWNERMVLWCEVIYD